MKIGKTKAVVALLAISVISVGAFVIANQSQHTRAEKAQYPHLRFVGNNDKAGLRIWAKSICHGGTLNSIATQLGVNPTMKAITRALSQGLPPASLHSVRDACESQIARATEAP